MSENTLRGSMERLARLEADVEHLKNLLLRDKEDAEKPWWEKIAGSHKDDKVFAEIARLGAEIRRKNPNAGRGDKGRRVAAKKRGNAGGKAAAAARK
jgi:hypothetical protein